MNEQTKWEKLLSMCKDLDFDREAALALLSKERINRKFNDTTLLYQAIHSENVEMIKLLLDNGADPNFYAHTDGPPLWELQYKRFFNMDESKLLEIVKLLLEHGANPCVEWEYETLYDYVIYQILNEKSDEDWEYLKKYIIYLVAYGASSKYYCPKLYEKIDKERIDDYDFRVLGGYGEIVLDGRTVGVI